MTSLYGERECVLAGPKRFKDVWLDGRRQRWYAVRQRDSTVACVVKPTGDRHSLGSEKYRT